MSSSKTHRCWNCWEDCFRESRKRLLRKRLLVIKRQVLKSNVLIKNLRNYFSWSDSFQRSEYSLEKTGDEPLKRNTALLVLWCFYFLYGPTPTNFQKLLHFMEQGHNFEMGRSFNGKKARRELLYDFWHIREIQTINTLISEKAVFFKRTCHPVHPQAHLSQTRSRAYSTWLK